MGLMQLENGMPKKTDLRLNNTLPIGKNTAEAQDQNGINKWQKSATMLFAFGTRKARVQNQ